MSDKVRTALEAAREELNALHGMVAADETAPEQTWVIDASATIALIDEALADSTEEVVGEPFETGARPAW